VGAVDRAVEAVPFVVAVRLHGLEQAFPAAILGPAIEPIEDGAPWPELIGQIAPWNACPPLPEYSFDEAPLTTELA
jgi:hypothetical protein